MPRFISEPFRICVSILVYKSILCFSVNIARNKSANQIGAYGGATADRAIDGRLDQSIGGDTYLNVCAFADTTWDNNVPANWKLDLKAVYRIADVVIYNTYHDTGNKTVVLKA